VFLSLTWSNITPHEFSFISHFLVYHRERAIEIVGLLAAPSVLDTGNTSLYWLSFLPIQILFGVKLSREVNSWQGLPVAKYVLKVHKNENFFGFDFEFCTISVLVMHK
jgi:hypothetical protein